MLFDTHAHFNDNRYKHDRDETIRNAHDSGVLNLSEERGTIQAWSDWLPKRLRKLNAKALRRLLI